MLPYSASNIFSKSRTPNLFLLRNNPQFTMAKMHQFCSFEVYHRIYKECIMWLYNHISGWLPLQQPDDDHHHPKDRLVQELHGFFLSWRLLCLFAFQSILMNTTAAAHAVLCSSRGLEARWSGSHLGGRRHASYACKRILLSFGHGKLTRAQGMRA